MPKKLKIIMCPIDEEPYETEVEDKLEDLQKLVGGYIEVVRFGDVEDNYTRYFVVCNEEGLIMKLPYNCHVCDFPFVGNIFIVKDDSPEFGSVKPGLLARFKEKYWKRDKDDFIRQLKENL